jgi:FkbM family methyltransferase
MVKLRNQANAVVGYRVSLGADSTTNGESWVAELIAPFATRFVDVGANQGVWTELFGSRMPRPRGLAFEPGPDTFKLLTSRMSKLGFEDVECHMLAAGHQSGRLNFYTDGAGDETASLVPPKHAAKASTIIVDVVRLDDFFDGQQSETIDMLKIDAEGYDYYILLGAARLLRSGSVRVVQFEYNAHWIQAGATLARAVEFLIKIGYVTYILKGRSLYSFRHDDLGEYFRYTNLIAYRPGHPILDSIRKLPII